MSRLEQFTNHLRGPDWENTEALQLRTPSEVSRMTGLPLHRVEELAASALVKMRNHLIGKLGELNH